MIKIICGICGTESTPKSYHWRCCACNQPFKVIIDRCLKDFIMELVEV